MVSRPPKQRVKPVSLTRQTRKQQNKKTDQRRGNSRDRGYTTRWDKARLQHLNQEPLCRECMQAGVINDGTKDTDGRPQKSKNKRGLVVDHIKPHGGDKDLFWLADNWQTLCIPHHNSKKQAEEKAGSMLGKARPESLKPSLVPLAIVCGAPCSGKNTYVEAMKSPGDLVIDLDNIAANLSGEPMHAWQRRVWLAPALAHRNRLLKSLSEPNNFNQAWFIVSEARADRRQWWVDKLHPRRMVVIETEPLECMRRISLEKERHETAEATRQAIRQWWQNYTRREGDEQLTNWKAPLNGQPDAHGVIIL